MVHPKGLPDSQRCLASGPVILFYRHPVASRGRAQTIFCHSKHYCWGIKLDIQVSCAVYLCHYAISASLSPLFDIQDWWYISSKSLNVQSCASLPSCCLCQLSLWVGTLRKWNAPKIKCWGLTRFIFRICSICLFSKGLHPPHSLEARQRRVIYIYAHVSRTMNR